MPDTDQLFWQATVEELRQGYSLQNRVYTCLICGEQFEQGVIYPKGDLLFAAERAAAEHVQAVHGPMHQYLLNLNKKLTGLTEIQKELMELFFAGLSDKEISERQGSSSSTIRHHRYRLREREKQARIFLALMGLLSQKDDFIPIHKGATMVDDRYAITEQEREKVLSNFMRDGKITALPAKQKRKLIILQYLAEQIEAKREYTEKEINALLSVFFDDYATLRRYLIEYGFLDRDPDGSRYWLIV